MEPIDNGRWVAERLETIAPAWTPDTARARAAVEPATSPGRPRGAWAAAAALAGLLLAFAALPQGRALAQEVWFRLFLNRVDVVRLNLSDSPFDTSISGSGERAVATVDEAAALAGFRPRLPGPASWPGTPNLSVIGAMTISQTLLAAELRAALARSGAGDVTVPPEWDHLTVRAAIGPIVQADYPDEIQILQSRPVQLLLPPGFPLERFAETVFRGLGLQWAEARALARRYTANPSLLLGIPADEPARIEEVHLRAGSGLLIEELREDGSIERVTLMLTTPDGIYSILSPSRAVCLQLADLVP